LSQHFDKLGKASSMDLGPFRDGMVDIDRKAFGDGVLAKS
jgi:hypothetical protein